MRAVGIAVLLLSPLAPALAASPPGSLDALPDDATLEIHYVSNGCFHHEDRTIVIRKTPELVAEIGPGGSSNGPGGTVPLTGEDLEALDHLIVYLRTNPAGLCTTQDDIRLTWRLPGAQPMHEHFVDGSCRSVDEPYMSLWLLVRRTLRSKASQ